LRIEFAPTATRHGISRDRIRYVIDHCRNPLYPPPDDRDDRDLVLLLGPDARGVPLEVVAIETQGDGLFVIHAMRLRSKYADDYMRVMGQG
jgi:hypothetical protein